MFTDISDECTASIFMIGEYILDDNNSRTQNENLKSCILQKKLSMENENLIRNTISNSIQKR